MICGGAGIEFMGLMCDLIDGVTDVRDEIWSDAAGDSAAGPPNTEPDAVGELEWLLEGVGRLRGEAIAPGPPWCSGGGSGVMGPSIFDTIDPGLRFWLWRFMMARWIGGGWTMF